ncbi:MAG TPA: low molecular weight phosphatase family protein [Mycobacteriales bacterium]|nr:low molecular weight phosphatase family protein [Mycobacteriales bacterium]
MTQPTDGAQRYRILLVCTGNICRSPFAERLLRARLDERFGADAGCIEVSSAGTWGLVDEPMQPEAAETLRRYGGDPEGFTAQALGPELIEAADLVLALTREHRAKIVMMSPRAAARTVTLLEYARLLSGVTAADVPPADGLAARFRALTKVAFGRRGYVPLDDPADDDVPDPYGGKPAGYERAAELIAGALDVPLALL